MPRTPIEELESMVGDSYAVVEDLAVEAGKVEEFARSLRNDDPVYRDDAVASDRGFESIPAQLTFTRTARFPRYRSEGRDDIRPFAFGFDPERLLHAEQEYEYTRPVRVGDVLRGEITLTDVYRREGDRGGEMTFAVTELDFYDRDDGHVLTERGTIVETGQPLDADDE
jgi:hypothetical protein